MFTLILLAALALSNSYQALVLRVVDGDTVNVSVRIWPDQDVYTSIRVRGLDTPELRGRCAAERELAQRAKARVADLLPVGAQVTVSQIAADKYGGRYDAEVTLIDGRRLAAILIEEGLARPYKGEKRAGWCDDQSLK